jgi:hypothetical protein
VRSSLQKRLKDKDKDNKPKPKAAAATTKSEGTQEESKGFQTRRPRQSQKPLSLIQRRKVLGKRVRVRRRIKAKVRVKERRQSQIPSQRLIRSQTKHV